MLEPILAGPSLNWLWPELALIAGYLLLRLLEHAEGIAWMSPRRAAPMLVMVALAASFAVPFEPAALAGDLFRSDPPAIAGIRLVLVATLAGLAFGADLTILPVSLAACLAARASDALAVLVVLQFMSLALVVVAVRSSGSTVGAARRLGFDSAAGAMAAIGFAGILAATSQSAFAPFSISLAHRDALGGGLAVAALLPVAVIATRLAAMGDGGTGLSGGHVPAVTRRALAVIVPAGLMIMLLRLTGTGFGGDVGSNDAGAAARLPWRTIIGLVALGAMARGTLTAFGARRTDDLVSGLLMANTGWALAGVAEGTMTGARAALLALITALPAALVLRSGRGDASTADDAWSADDVSTPEVASAADDASTSDESSTAGTRRAAPARGLWHHSGRLAGVVALLSLAGSPGTLGFIGRWSVWDAARAGTAWWLAAAGTLLWVLGVTAALRWFAVDDRSGDDTIGVVGRVLALLVLAGALFGGVLQSLVAGTFPFP